MGLETGTFINSLVATNPTGSDLKSQGDDHLRLIKSTLLSTFPAVTGAVTPTHTELNFVDGVTSAIQPQIDTKAPIASPTFTGTVGLPSTTSIGNVSATEIAFVDGVTSSIQTQIDSKSPIIAPSFTGGVTVAGVATLNGGATVAGTVSLPATTSIGTVSSTEIGYLDSVTSSIQTQIDTKSPIASPTFTGVPAAPTATTGTNTTQLATTAFVNSTALAASLPNQVGNNGKYLVTDGTNASWSAVPAGLYYDSKSANYTAVFADDKKVFFCTGTFTLSFLAAATLGNGWMCYVRNTGSGVITLDANASELIGGLTTMTVNVGETYLIQCNGAEFRALVIDRQTFSYARIFSTSTTATTFTVPANVFAIRAYLFGAGGAGATVASAAAGGGGGSCSYGTIPTTPGTVFTFTIAGSVVTLNVGGTNYLTSNSGAAGSAGTGGAGGAAGSVGAGLNIADSGAFAGGAGGTATGGPAGGGSAGSPIGTGFTGGASTTLSYGAGGAGLGGAGGANSAATAGGGGGGVGGAGAVPNVGNGGGAGGAASATAPGPERSPANLFTDPLLAPCIASGGVGQAVTSGCGGSAGPGGGGGGAGNNGTGGSGGFGGGGGGVYNNGYGGRGGFGGGGGGAGVGGIGGIGGGGGGGNPGGAGGSAAALIFY